MSAVLKPSTVSAGIYQRSALHDPAWLRSALIAIAIGFIFLFLCVPLGLVLVNAFSKGWTAYWLALVQPDALAAIKLTLVTALIVVPLNTVFGYLRPGPLRALILGAKVF